MTYPTYDPGLPPRRSHWTPVWAQSQPTGSSSKQDSSLTVRGYDVAP